MQYMEKNIIFATATGMVNKNLPSHNDKKTVLKRNILKKHY